MSGPTKLEILTKLVDLLRAEDQRALEADVLRRATVEGWVVVPQHTPDLSLWEGHVYRNRDHAASLATELSVRTGTRRAVLRVTVHLNGG